MLKQINYAIIISILLSFCNSGFCQSTAKREISNYFDKTVGDEILNSNNGKIHIDSYTLKNDHNYYLNKNFVTGTVYYDNQRYENILIRYDIYKDELVKSFGNTNSLALDLIKEKTDYFLIAGKTFVNIDNKYKFAKDISGYFEEKYLGKSASLYIKHFKTSKEVIIETTAYTEFKEQRDFELLFESKFSKINTQKEIASIFPQLKSEIKEYYRKNKFLEETDPDQFKADLIKFIDNNLQSLSSKN